MADVKKIATRESYGNTLKELAAEGHEDLVVLDADLAAATKTGMFRKATKSLTFSSVFIVVSPFPSDMLWDKSIRKIKRPCPLRSVRDKGV